MYNAGVILDAANKLNIPIHGVGIIPFTHEFVGAEGIDFTLPTFFYGSTRMAEIAARDYPNQGVWLNENFNVFNPKEEARTQPLRDDFLNPYPMAIKFKDFKENTKVVNHYKSIAETGTPIFFRPSSSLKLFAGSVMTAKNADELIETISDVAIVHPDELVCISEYKDIWAEWRFFVVDGDVISGSQYKESGRLDIRPASRDICMVAQAFTRKWMPSNTCVIDLALTTDGIKVIEFNSVNASGFYDTDAEKVLVALRELLT